MKLLFFLDRCAELPSFLACVWPVLLIKLHPAPNRNVSYLITITILIIRANSLPAIEGSRGCEGFGKSWKGVVRRYEDLRAVLFHASNQLRGLPTRGVSECGREQRRDEGG